MKMRSLNDIYIIKPVIIVGGICVAVRSAVLGDIDGRVDRDRV